MEHCIAPPMHSALFRLSRPSCCPIPKCWRVSLLAVLLPSTHTGEYGEVYKVNTGTLQQWALQTLFDSNFQGTSHFSQLINYKECFLGQLNIYFTLSACRHRHSLAVVLQQSTKKAGRSFTVLMLCNGGEDTEEVANSIVDMKLYQGVNPHEPMKVPVAISVSSVLR